MSLSTEILDLSYQREKVANCFDLNHFVMTGTPNDLDLPFYSSQVSSPLVYSLNSVGYHFIIKAFSWLYYWQREVSSYRC